MGNQEETGNGIEQGGRCSGRRIPWIRTRAPLDHTTYLGRRETYVPCPNTKLLCRILERTRESHFCVHVEERIRKLFEHPASTFRIQHGYGSKSSPHKGAN